MSRRQKHSPLLDFLTTRAWALDENVLAQLTQVVVRHANGVRIEEEEVEAIVAARDAKKGPRKADYEMRGSTAVIPITGVIAKHASQVNDVSQPQGTATTTVSAMLRQALADDAVKSILLAVDSPGGSIDGVQALADEIHAARGVKPIVAHADGMAASAAYWLASQADKVLATSDSAVGSIGVYSVVGDLSRLYKNEGVDMHVIRNGALKGAGARGTPVTGEQMAAIQTQVDAYAALFHESVQRGRGMSEKALKPLADGSVFIGKRAVDAGLIDGIATLEQALAGMGGGQAIAAEITAESGAECVATDCAVDLGAASEPTPGAIAAQPQPAGEATNEDEMTLTSANAAPAPGVELTADAVTQSHPKAAAALLAAGAQAERARISAIRNLGVTGQEALVEKLVADGTSEPEALRALHADLKARNGKGLQALIDTAPKSTGAAAPTETFVEGSSPAAETPKPTADGKRNWLAEAQAKMAKQPHLAREFGDAETLAKYMEGASKGVFGPGAQREVI